MTATLTDLCAAIVDCEHKTAPAGDGFALSIGTKAMRDGRLVLASCKPVSSETYRLWTRRLEPVEGDLILAREAPVGDVVRVPDGLRVCLGQRTVLIRPDPDRVDPRFLHYWLLGPIAQTDMDSRAGGATVPHLNVEDIRELDVTALPADRELQSQAGAILGAIDDLIENNRRRIALLQQMAQASYREWFVHFRYPGHEGDELVDSPLGPIPVGWELTTLAEQSTALVDGDWIETKDQGGSDYRLLQVSNIGVGSFRETGNFRFITADTFERLRCTEIHVGDILISRMPDPIGRAWLVDGLDSPAVTAVDVAILRPLSPEGGSFLQHWLNSPQTLARAEAVATGTTRKRISRSVLGSLALVMPPGSHVSRFHATVAPMAELSSTLRQTSVRLATMRDVLLPKLVTGTIDVSKLDLGAALEESAA